MILYKFIKNLLLHTKYSNILKRVYKEENLIHNLSNLFGSKFKTDWIGRIYVVLNPNLSNQKLDTTTQIFEYNEKGLDNTAYVERWVMQKLNVASEFIVNNNLFDILTFEIRKLDEFDNYLLIIEPVTLKEFLKWAKYFSMEVLIFICLLIFYFTIFN